jgi:hypothetical protein
MIRIDEIYNNTFWPWLEKNRPGTRMFFCDPPGHTGPEHLFNIEKDNISKTDLVFFHDQEPVDLDLYGSLFNEIIFRNLDTIVDRHKGLLNSPYVHWNNSNDREDFAKWRRSTDQGTDAYFRTRPDKFASFLHSNPTLFQAQVIVSERGDNVKSLCDTYGWHSHYYFYHGWACLDWYRGYDRTYLIPRARDRAPTRTFMSPNRIVAGKRDHRVLFLYNIYKQGLENNHISAPRVCQYEGVDISIIAQKYTNVYQDITDVLNAADLPRLFAGEAQQEMHSYQLGNFVEAQDSLVYVPTETVYFGRRTHLTEKTFKAIALEMPFVLVAPAGSLEYLREYGFKTFSGIFDEIYDAETDDLKRMEQVIKLLKDINSLSNKERQQLHRACIPIVEHNFNHFYRGGFGDILWKELVGMLKGLHV